MRKDVFISYSKDDRTAAEQVCSQLEEAGIGCWIAPRDIAPGVTWPAAITEAIRNCRAMVVIFSSNANRSPHMAREVEVADSRHVPILPVRVEEIEPAGDMEYFLGNRQWFDLHHGKVERRRALPDAIASLLRDVGDAAAVEEAPKRAAAPAPAKKAFPVWAAVVVVLAVAGGVAAYLLRPARVSAPSQAPVAQAPVAQPPIAQPPAAQPPAPTPTPAPKPAAKAAKVDAPPAKPAADFSGKWQAEVKYNWGAVHKETFDFKVDEKELMGTASYIRTPRGILDGKIDGNRISFTTKSMTLLGSQTYEEKHYYKGRMTADGIEFMLQTESGYDSRTPEMFTAKRVE